MLLELIPISGQQSFVQMLMQPNPQNRLFYSSYKTMLCQNFLKNQCQFGNECRFAHGTHELRLPKPQHPKYKTVICRNFAQFGACQYGSRCAFIHERKN